MTGYLSVVIGGVRCGMPLTHIRQVIDIDEVHAAPSRHPAVCGVIRTGGRVMPLVHLGRLLTGEEVGPHLTHTAVVGDCAEVLVAFMVEDADEVVRAETQAVPEGWDLPWACAVAREGGDLVPIVDMRLVADRLAEEAADER